MAFPPLNPEPENEPIVPEPLDTPEFEDDPALPEAPTEDDPVPLVPDPSEDSSNLP